jgi:hypothetical protein
MALSGHANPADECPLWGNNGHDADVTRCLLVNQSGPSQWFLTGNKLGQVATFSAESNESTRPGEVRASWLSFVTCLRRL